MTDKSPAIRNLADARRVFDKGEGLGRQAIATKRYAVAAALVLGASNAVVQSWGASAGWATPIRAALKSLNVDSVTALGSVGVDKLNDAVAKQVKAQNDAAKKAREGKTAKGAAAKKDVKVSDAKLTVEQFFNLVSKTVPELDANIRVNLVALVRDAVLAADRAEAQARRAA